MLQSGLYLKRIKGAAMAKVKISDVAREAGVSLGTVSNALNHPEKLRPETLKLINETINRLGYLPNQSARQLAGGATKSFGLVLPRLDHGFSLQIASGAHNEARKHGYDLLIANADNDDILEDHYLRYFMGTQMSGVMVQPMASPDWHPAMTKMPVPIVHLDIHCSEPGYYVAADNEAQGRIIAELAIARGAHHIVVVGRAAFMQLTLRVLGIHKALALHPDIKIEVIDAGEWNTAADDKIGAFVGAGRQRHRRPRASTRSRLRWQPTRLERIGPAHYGSAPGLRDWPQGRSIAHGANREQGPSKDQAYPRRLYSAHRHRSHRRRGHQPPRTGTSVPAGTRQHPGKQPDRRHGHQPRCVSIARPQVC